MRPIILAPAFAVLVAFIAGRSDDNGLVGADFAITVNLPARGATYDGIIEANIELGVGDGRIAAELRQEPEAFALCLDWDTEYVRLGGTEPLAARKSADLTRHCSVLAGDGASPLPAFDSAALRNGRYLFRASLHRAGETGGASLVLSDVEYLLLNPQARQAAPAPSHAAAAAGVQAAGKVGSIGGQVRFTEERLERGGSCGSTAAATRAEVGEVTVRAEGVNGEAPRAPPSPRMPCSWAGTFTAVAPWSVAFSTGPTPPLALAGPPVDIPLDLTGALSWAAVDTLLRPQFLELCAGNFPRIEGRSHTAAAEVAGWDPVGCSADLMRQTAEWATARCAEAATEATGDETSWSEEAASLDLLRASVGSALGMPRGWALADLDERFEPGLQEVTDAAGDDGCGSLGVKGMGIGMGPALIVGALVTDGFVRRQRDFILRDLLGCLPEARVCVDEGRSDAAGIAADAAAECADMLRYASTHKRAWECGPCRELSPAGRFTVLVSSLSQLSGDSSDDGGGGGGDGGGGTAARDFALKALWRPAVIVHVNDESAAGAGVLRRFYGGARLVLRMYGPMGGSTERASRGADASFEGLPPVVTIPVGYLNGFPDGEGPDGEGPGAQPRSGTEAVRASIADGPAQTVERPLRWAFVGTRNRHHPHTSDARTAMASFLSSTEGLCHVTDRDG